MAVLLVRLDWDYSAIPLREGGRYFTLRISPEPQYPFGRKGLTLVSAWRQLGGDNDGMVILDGDVAIDPCDTAAMLAAIDGEPEAVHVAPVKLWPVSTKIGHWVWGHGESEFSQHDTDDPVFFAFSFTYLPRGLIEACISAGMQEWTYPHVDQRTLEVATAMSVAVRVVRGATPKHLNT